MLQKVGRLCFYRSACAFFNMIGKSSQSALLLFSFWISILGAEAHHTRMIPPTDRLQFTVAKHNSPQSCWVIMSSYRSSVATANYSVQVILYGNVYDVTNFLPHHPGGSKTVRGLRTLNTSTFGFSYQFRFLNWLARTPRNNMIPSIPQLQ